MTAALNSAGGTVELAARGKAQSAFDATHQHAPTSSQVCCMTAQKSRAHVNVASARARNFRPFDERFFQGRLVGTGHIFSSIGGFSSRGIFARGAGKAPPQAEQICPLRDGCGGDTNAATPCTDCDETGRYGAREPLCYIRVSSSDATKSRPVGSEIHPVSVSCPGNDRPRF
jgi:hypothetical protein